MSAKGVVADAGVAIVTKKLVVGRSHPVCRDEAQPAANMIASSDQPGTPPSRATGARGSRLRQAEDPLQAIEEPVDLTQSASAATSSPPSREASKGHQQLTVRTTPALKRPIDTAHPLAASLEDDNASSPAGASPHRPVASPIASKGSQDSLASQVLAQARSIGVKVRHDAVNFAAIARNPLLARQARAELDEHQHTTAIEQIDTDGPAASAAFYAHDAEVERQWAALEAVNADTKEESTLNKELSFLICARLEASRRSSERLLCVLQVILVFTMFTLKPNEVHCH